MHKRIRYQDVTTIHRRTWYGNIILELSDTGSLEVVSYYMYQGCETFAFVDFKFHQVIAPLKRCSCTPDGYG